jgi:hypothetical protein
LPEEDCPIGTMAILGETTCQPIASCGSGSWGDIPSDANTQHVDPSYTGGGNDGTAAAPWLTLTEAMAAASAGDVVALAAGDYPGPVALSDGVTLWGRCPEMVSITGAANQSAVTMSAASELRGLRVVGGAVGVDVVVGPATIREVSVQDSQLQGIVVRAPSTLNRVAVEGTGDAGIFVTGSTLTMDDAWLHDSDWIGVAVFNAGAQRSEAQVTGLVVERVSRVGVLVQGSDATLEDCAIRDLTEVGNAGRGIHTQIDDATLLRGQTTLRRCSVERAVEHGVSFSGSDGLMEDVTILDTLARSDGSEGQGLMIRNNDATGEASDVVVDHATVESSRLAGVTVAGATAELGHLLVRDTLPRVADDEEGRGLAVVEQATSNSPPNVTLTDGILEGNHGAGLSNTGGELLVERSIVRETEVEVATGLFGRGITSQGGTSPDQATLEVRDSWVQDNHEVAVSAFHGRVVLDNVAVMDTGFHGSDGTGGIGIGLQTFAGIDGVTFDAAITDCEVVRGHGVGLFALNFELQVVGTRILDIAGYQNPDPFGDGVSILGFETLAATASFDRCRFENSFRAGLSSASADISVANSVFECNAIHLNGEAINGPFSITDGGGNRCGCDGVEAACKVESAGLTPPSPLQ